MALPRTCLHRFFRPSTSLFLSRPFAPFPRYLTTVTSESKDVASTTTSSPKPSAPTLPPLSLLPTPLLLRSLLVNTISSTPWLLIPSMSLLSFFSRQPPASLFNADRNPLIHFILKKTFYEHFCAGENAAEVRTTVGNVKGMGFTGVILGYARETVKKEEAPEAISTKEPVDTGHDAELEAWKDGNLRTIQLASEGDFVAMKFSGAGQAAHDALSTQSPPSPKMLAALSQICAAASSRNVRILIDAEHTTIQPGIDAWALHLMLTHNTSPPNHARIFNTYQTYLKATPQTLLSHLSLAQVGRFTLGVKLVRGAYISSEPRALINATKTATDAQFDAAAAGIIQRTYGSFTPGTMPPVALFLATHNHESVRKASALHRAQQAQGHPTMPVEYGQLLGMADEVSCELLQSRSPPTEQPNAAVAPPGPRVYKCLSWGTVGECVAYLMRRGVENRDAVGRTRDGRVELQREVWRRVRGFVGLS